VNKPLILGLDMGSVTGWALWDTNKHRSSIECGVFEFPEKASIEYRAAQIGLKLTELVRRAKKDYERPIDMAVAEEALKLSLKGTQSTIVSCMLHGAVYGTLANHGIMWGTMSVRTWRSQFFGKGYQPPQKMVKKKVKGVDQLAPSDDWKQAALNACEEMGVSLPSSKAKAHNAAEAAAVAICWQSAKLHAGRYQQRFIALRTGKAA
jgi:Holliday junction resolvasome RuvABC endonuclease subunit